MHCRTVNSFIINETKQNVNIILSHAVCEHHMHVYEGLLDTYFSNPNQFKNLRISRYGPLPVFVGSILQEMQQGVNDVLPSSAFDNLTAEDLHLLMNGSPVVDVEVLKKITSFMDESREVHMA